MHARVIFRWYINIYIYMYIYICIYTADCNQYDLDLIDRIARSELCNKHFMHVYSLVLICCIFVEFSHTLSRSRCDWSFSRKTYVTPYTVIQNWTKCVCCFVVLYRYWGIVTVPGSIPYGSRPGVAGSSPCTLFTSLAIPVPSSSSSNGPTTVPLTTMGLSHGGSVSWAGPKFVRPHWWES